MKFSLHNHHRPHHQHLNSSINISRNIINIIIVFNIIYIIMIISIISVLLMLLMIVIIMPMLASPGISTRTLAMTPSSRLSRLFPRRGERGGGARLSFIQPVPTAAQSTPQPPSRRTSLHTQLVHHLLVLAWLLPPLPPPLFLLLLLLLLAASYLTLTNQLLTLNAGKHTRLTPESHNLELELPLALALLGRGRKGLGVSAAPAVLH